MSRMLEEMLDTIQFNESRHAGLKSRDFSELSLDQRMEFIKLKVKLGEAHLKVANLLPSNQLERRGYHLRSVVRYHPFLVPTLVNVNTRLLPQTNAEKTGEDVAILGAGIGLLPLFVVLPALELITLGNVDALLSAPKKTAHLAYVHLFCLGEIDPGLSSDTCLSIAVAHLFDGNGWLAVRYVLEAGARSTEINHEIPYYFARALQHLRGPIRSLSFGREEDDFFESAIYAIKQKVLNNRHAPKDSLLYFIWEITDPSLPRHEFGTVRLHLPQLLELNDFYKKFAGRLPSNHVDYEITIAELSNHLQDVLSQKHPNLRACTVPEPPFPTESQLILKDLTLAETVALMTQVTIVPREIINASLINLSLPNKVEQETLRERLLALEGSAPQDGGPASTRVDEIEMTTYSHNRFTQ